MLIFATNTRMQGKGTVDDNEPMLCGATSYTIILSNSARVFLALVFFFFSFFVSLVSFCVFSGLPPSFLCDVWDVMYDVRFLSTIVFVHRKLFIGLDEYIHPS